MNRRKQFIKISLISLILFGIIGISNVSYGGLGDVIKDIIENPIDSLVQGVVGILTLGFQQLLGLIFVALQGLIAAITGFSGDGAAWTIGDIVFNNCQITSINFFPQLITDGVAVDSTITTQIGKFYFIIRNLSIAILLFVLIYIGIRMAISTVASDEAKYKKMFKDWAVSLAIVYVLHFIIILTIYANNGLVNALATLDDGSAFSYQSLCQDIFIPGFGWPDLIVYGAFVVSTLIFVLMYVKRTITLAFLIVIAPLITITYSIDKMGDGKSQALNTWLKEFVFTVLIQPFHCIIYLVFYSTITEPLEDGIADMQTIVYALGCTLFMLKAEGIVKKIFGIKADSMGDALGTGAMAIGMMTGLMKNKGGKSIKDGKGKMAKMKGNAANANGATSNRTENNEGSSLQDSQQGSSSNENGQNANSTGDSNSTGNGNSNTQTSNNSSPYSANTAQANSNRPQVSQGKIKSALNKVKNNAATSWTRKGGMSGYMERSFARAATMAGVIAGATVGDVKTAASLGATTGAFAKGRLDEHKYNKNERQLEENQEVFAGAYQDFARAYRQEHGDVSDEQIWAAAEELYNSRIDKTDIQKEYELDFYNQMDQLSNSAEIMGYDDGFSYVKSSMRATDAGEIGPPSDYIPKNYTESDSAISYESLINSNGITSNREVAAAQQSYGEDYENVNQIIRTLQVDRSASSSINRTERIKAFKELRTTMEHHNSNDKEKEVILRKYQELINKNPNDF